MADESFEGRHVEEDEFLAPLKDCVDALVRHDVPYAAMGGIASSVLGRNRWTHDIDLFVAPYDADPLDAAIARRTNAEPRRSDLEDAHVRPVPGPITGDSSSLSVRLAHDPRADPWVPAPVVAISRTSRSARGLQVHVPHAATEPASARLTTIRPAGSTAVTTRPPPGRGRASTSPPWARATARTIDSPSPAPAGGGQAFGVQAAERLEQRRDLVPWHDRTGVGHLDLDVVVPGPGAAGDAEPPAVGAVVPNAVLDEIVHEPFEEECVAGRDGLAGVYAHVDPGTSASVATWSRTWSITSARSIGRCSGSSFSAPASSSRPLIRRSCRALISSRSVPRCLTSSEAFSRRSASSTSARPSVSGSAARVRRWPRTGAGHRRIGPAAPPWCRRRRRGP